MQDPFIYHPELRALITDPDSSALRRLDPEDLRRTLAEKGLPAEWIHSEAEREADRERALADRPDGDLWIFAYGSLMWDPAIHFEEVRHAFAPSQARVFILKDTLGARGTPEQPGVMAALDHGAGCHGLAFRIAAAKIDRETEILWRRERIAPGYLSTFIALETAGGPVEALAFLANHEAEGIDAGMSWEEQVRFCATGSGFLGTSLEYVENLVRHFDALKIDDPDLLRLRDAARGYSGA